ncbi:hypothetical protein M0R45_008607 [Rubus argutus]|uniref:Uncharacterized protein n=1 Tax=Rubus argutus TaxID=59490 RepID=A0AAW1Y479_RUBAR
MADCWARRRKVQVQQRAEELGGWIDGVVERERNWSGGDDASLGVAGLLDMVDEGDGKEDSGALGKMQR